MFVILKVFLGKLRFFCWFLRLRRLWFLDGLFFSGLFLCLFAIVIISFDNQIKQATEVVSTIIGNCTSDILRSYD
nr:MAG TPA: hypothetical protein [Caudoviricetes sp.]